MGLRSAFRQRLGHVLRLLLPVNLTPWFDRRGCSAPRNGGAPAPPFSLSWLRVEPRSGIAPLTSRRPSFVALPVVAPLDNVWDSLRWVTAASSVPKLSRTARPVYAPLPTFRRRAPDFEAVFSHRAQFVGDRTPGRSSATPAVIRRMPEQGNCINSPTRTAAWP